MTENTPRCQVCDRSSHEIPVFKLVYQGNEYWVCPQELPIIIHEPQKLIGLLPGADKLKGHGTD